MSDWKKLADEYPPPMMHVLTCIYVVEDGKEYRSYCVDWWLGTSWAVQHKYQYQPTAWMEIPEYRHEHQ
jgi:hypothetical protein